MSANGATKRDLFRVIAEKDAEIGRLFSENRRLALLVEDLRAWEINPSTPIVIGSKVRRIDEPYVVLRVREIDPEGGIDGTPKALCTNAYAHGRWMALTELEVVT